MTQEDKSGSIDPVSGDVDELLQAVPAETLELLDTESAKELETSFYYMDWLTGVKKHPEPFSARASEPADFSFLPPEKAELAEAVLSGKLSIPKGYSAPVARQAYQVSGAATDSYGHCRKSLHSAGEEIKKIGKDIDEQILVPFHERSYRFNIYAVAAAINGLYGQAAVIPSRATTQAIETLYRRAKFLEDKAKGRNPTAIAGRLVQVQSKKTEQNIENTARLARHRSTVTKLGTTTYDLLRPVINFEEAMAAATVLVCVDRAREKLAVLGDSSRISQLSTTEQFLLGRAKSARSVLASADRTVLEIPSVKKALSNLSSRSLVGEAIQEERRRRLDEAKEFSVQLSVARDIALGGQRLKPNKLLSSPADVASQLEPLLENLEGAAKRGLVIAILSGRFTRLQESLERLLQESYDEAVRTMEAERPDVVRILRELGASLTKHMEDLRDLTIFDPDNLSAAIGEPGLEKVIKAVDDYFNPPEKGESSPMTSTGSRSIEEALPHSELINQLDWTVLPQEERELEWVAIEIVEAAKKRVAKGAKIEIDLERLTILKNVRQVWNERHGNSSHHFYARGTLKDRGLISVEGDDHPDEYIVLVLQKKDEQGKVILEHAIAESPITRVNALYLLRSDVAPGSWEEIFSLSKKEARGFGARGLHHTKGDGRSVVEVLTDRVNLLLNCPPEDFFSIRFDGARIWLRRRLGHSAIN